CHQGRAGRRDDSRTPEGADRETRDLSVADPLCRSRPERAVLLFWQRRLPRNRRSQTTRRKVDRSPTWHGSDHRVLSLESGVWSLESGVWSRKYRESRESGEFGESRESEKKGATRRGGRARAARPSGPK